MSSRHHVHSGGVDDEGRHRQTRRSRVARSNTSQTAGGSRGSRASSRSRTRNCSDRSEGHGSGENDRLREQLAQAKAKSRAASAEVKNLRQQVRRQGKLIDKLKADLAVARASDKSLEVTRVSDTDAMKGKSGSWLTPGGAVSLAAVRRNMSNIATDDLGRVILTDISRTSVSRSESKAAASLQMTSRMFFESIDELLRQPAHGSSERSDESPGPRGPTGFAFYSYRQDATHHRIKKSTLELETGIIIDHQEYNHRTPFMDTARTLRQLSDVLNITDETSAGTLAFTRKALASLGCPFMDTIQDVPNILFLEMNCLEHGVHLVCLSGLQLMDKLLKAHERLLAAGADRLRHVLEEVLDKSATPGAGLRKRVAEEAAGKDKVASDDARKRTGSRGRGRRGMGQGRGSSGQEDQSEKVKKATENLNPDALAVEAVQEYQQRMGKWRRHCLDVLADPVFEAVVRTMHAARADVMRCSHFLLSKISPEALHRKGNHLTQLVNGRAVEMLSSIEQLLGPEKESFWRSVCEGKTMNQDDMEFVATAATSMVLLHASAFERRVVLPLQQWPLLILRFSQHPAHLCVDARKELARTLLEAAPGDLDVNSRKFRDMFRHDLRHVQDHGMVPDRLCKFLNGLKSFYRADVRDCEKTNKVISLLLERCPRIGDDLLSSRVVLKHYLGETGAGAGFQHKK
ncbi:unnamed protein product [Symbiodinium sp. KB8]|nr:unnamed protein product [Symbiodinium sp. KB8]